MLNIYNLILSFNSKIQKSKTGNQDEGWVNNRVIQLMLNGEKGIQKN